MPVIRPECRVEGARIRRQCAAAADLPDCPNRPLQFQQGYPGQRNRVGKEAQSKKLARGIEHGLWRRRVSDYDGPYVERKGIIRTREGTPLYESQKTEGWFRGLGHDESTMERSQVEICFTDEEVEDGEPEDAQAISPELALALAFAFAAGSSSPRRQEVGTASACLGQREGLPSSES